MSDAAAAYDAEARLQTILKAVVVSAKTQDPASRPGGEELNTAFTSAGAIEPPYDPEALCLLMEHSNSLRQNVDAYATNIDGFGHRFEPAIDFDADDADDRISDAIYLERLAARERGDLEADAALRPTAEEVAARKQGNRPANHVPDGIRPDVYARSGCSSRPSSVRSRSRLRVSSFSRV